MKLVWFLVAVVVVVYWPDTAWLHCVKQLSPKSTLADIQDQSVVVLSTIHHHLDTLIMHHPIVELHMLVQQTGVVFESSHIDIGSCYNEKWFRATDISTLRAVCRRTEIKVRVIRDQAEEIDTKDKLKGDDVNKLSGSVEAGYRSEATSDTPSHRSGRAKTVQSNRNKEMGHTARGESAGT